MESISAAIISAETVSIIVLIIISISIINDKDKLKISRYFLACVISTIIILLSDILNYALEGNPFFTTILNITNFNTFLFGDILMCFFVLYVHSFVDSKKPTKKGIIYFVFTICAIDIIFETYGTLTGLTYKVIDGIFVPGPLYDACFIVMLLVLFICFVFLLFEVKTIGLKSLAVFFLYYILPVVSIVLIMINNDLSFICTSIAISFLIIYTGIEKRQKENIMIEMINNDIMTGLHNRNAFESYIDNIVSFSFDGNIGTIFADLNCLKATNDTLGHSAGDKLIVKYAKLLCMAFDKNDIYRISGDEFVIILLNIGEEDFKDRIKTLNHLNLNNDRISSFGYAYGKCNNVNELIKMSETMMYSEKQKFYEETGLDRRK